MCVRYRCNEEVHLASAALLGRRDGSPDAPHGGQKLGGQPSDFGVGSEMNRKGVCSEAEMGL